MSAHGGPDEVTSGLVLALDAADIKSYPRTGTVWYDRSGNGSTGILTGSVNYNNNSLIFTGGDIRGQINSILRLSSTVNNSSDYQFTIQAFYKSNHIASGSASSPRYTIFSFTDPTYTVDGYKFLDLEIWNNKYVIFNGDGVSYTTSGVIEYNNDLGTQSNTSGTITMVTMTIASGNYIQVFHNDNQLRLTKTLAQSVSSSNLVLGSRVTGNTLNGQIYKFKFYNRVLSPQEVLQNYNANKSRFGLS